MACREDLNSELVTRFSRWLLVQKYSRSTWFRYSLTIRKFSDFLNDQELTQTTHFDVQEYLAQCARNGASARAMRYELCALRHFFDFLNLGGLIKWNPPRMVRLPRFQPTLPQVLTLRQTAKLLRAAKNAYERTLLNVFYGTGCRTNEVRTMKVQNIDFERRRIRVDGKRGSRYVLFPAHIAKGLRNYLGTRRNGYVFVDSKPFQSLKPIRTTTGAWTCRWEIYGENGEWVGKRSGFVGIKKKMSYSAAKAHFAKLAGHDLTRRPLGIRPLSTSTVQKVVEKVGLRVGLDVHPYVLRHTLATHLVDNGADIRVIQEMLGHSSIRSTQIYTHVSHVAIQKTFDQCHPMNRRKVL
jgi:site-specific recombinase XerD